MSFQTSWTAVHQESTFKSAEVSIQEISESYAEGPTDPLEEALQGNSQWSQSVAAQRATTDLAKKQTPTIVWIGCSDSRVPETTVCGAAPGNFFVHRNIGCTLHDNDLNLHSVIEYALGMPSVTNIVVCGHTNCGAAIASLVDDDAHHPLSSDLKTWLGPQIQIRNQIQEELNKLPDDSKAAYLATANVVENARKLRKHPLITGRKSKAGELVQTTITPIIYDTATARLSKVDEDLYPRLSS